MTQPLTRVTELFDSNTALEVLAAAIRNLPGGPAALNAEIAATHAATLADMTVGSTTTVPTSPPALPGV